MSGCSHRGLRRVLRRDADGVHLVAAGSNCPGSSISNRPSPGTTWTCRRAIADNNLFSTRATYTLSPRMFVSALVQYQSRTSSMTINARFRWEYLPGSELFVVYSDGRTTLNDGFPGRPEPVVCREGHAAAALVVASRRS